MAEYKNMSYIGFSFNGMHSSDFNLYRVSTNDRYTTNINDSYEDKTMHIRGQKGSYYFGTVLKDKKIQISVAFDKLTEEKLSQLEMWINNSLIGELVFDETPYKAYWAKIDGAHDLKTLCFDEGGNNIYKGEMTLNFICYEPRAHSTFKFLNDYKPLPGSEYNEWQNSIVLWEQDKPLEREKNNKVVRARTYNPGDYIVYPEINFTIKAVDPFRMIRVRQYIPTMGTTEKTELYLDGGKAGAFLANKTYHFKIDTKTKIIYSSSDDNNITQGIFNQYISNWENRKDSFGIIPYSSESSHNYINFAITNQSNFDTISTALNLDYVGGSDSSASKIDVQLKYDYYYR